MKIVQNLTLIDEIDGRQFIMSIPHGCDWGSALKACANMLTAVNQMSAKAEIEAKRIEEEEAKAKEKIKVKKIKGDKPIAPEVKEEDAIN